MSSVNGELRQPVNVPSYTCNTIESEYATCNELTVDNEVKCIVLL